MPKDGPKMEGVWTLYIKNPAAHRRAEKLSKQMGVTLTDAVIHALEAQVRNKPRPVDRARVNALCEKLSALPVIDPRSTDEILGYDEFGIPR